MNKIGFFEEHHLDSAWREVQVLFLLYLSARMNKLEEQQLETEALGVFRLRRLVLPIGLGLCAVAYLFYTQFDPQQFTLIRWDERAFSWVFLAFLLLLLRHLSYALRLIAVTGSVFSWKKAVELVTLWEFSSLLAPTSKGGPVVAMYLFPKEGVSIGNTVAAVFYTILLDTGFFVFLLPVLLLTFGADFLFPADFRASSLASGAFFITYGFMASYWLFLVVLLFIRPTWTPIVLGKIGRLPFIRRWRDSLERVGLEIALASKGLRQASYKVHWRALLGTLGAWTCKFAMINCLMLAVFPEVPLDGFTQLFVYARLVAMFIIMTFSPTPGGAGLAEVALPRFISDFMPLSIGLVVALLWRGMAYYGYLIAGSIVAPNWFVKKNGKRTGKEP